MQSVSFKNRLSVRARPEGSALMLQKWRDLLFLHWKHDAEEIQKMLPSGLYVDTFQGKAYVTMTPFFMKDISLVNLPPMPGFSDFIEINVRTYVYDEKGMPGVWFFSLELNGKIAATAARAAFHLPYYYANLEGSKVGNCFVIEGKRADPEVPIKFSYQPTAGNSKRILDADDTVDFFLIERYAMYMSHADQLYSARVYHEPYSLLPVYVSEWSPDLLKVNGLKPFGSEPDLVHYSPGVDVEIFKIDEV